MSDTPKTDEAKFQGRELDGLFANPESEDLVMAEFARELERENVKLREALTHADLRLREHGIRDMRVIDALKA